MEQITAMKITGLTLTDFRNHKQAERYSFDDLTYISGHNGTGKTTMAHGIAYALYGVSYYGEQKIERLMNEQAAGTQVQLDFTDQNGKAHTLVRKRNGDKTALMLDTYTVRQTEIEKMFCDKDTFLSMFNPTYLTERLGEKGRTLILKYLKAVPSETVIAEMSENYRSYLDGIDLAHTSPEELLKGYRDMIRQSENQLTMLEGNIQSVKEAVESAEQKLAVLYNEKNVAATKLKTLSDKQFDGIDLDDLEILKGILTEKLMTPNSLNAAIMELKTKIEQVEQKPYVSKYAQAQTENRAQVKTQSEKYKSLANRIKGLRPGTQCPTCLMKITDQNLSDVRASMRVELENIAAYGRELVKQGQELAELDSKSEKVFEQFQRNDADKLRMELFDLEDRKKSEGNLKEIREQLEQIDEQLRLGNLSEDEAAELSALEADIIGIDAQIKAITEISNEKRLKDIYIQQKSLNEQILQYRNILAALTEYISKRTELSVSDIQMPNVKIKLCEVVRTTGELVSVFKFTYRGRDYTALSLSEKTLAGIEITAMIRKVTGIDCPICIDNVESIAAFNNVPMPSQTLLLCMKKGIPLTVQSRSGEKARPVQVQELKKAS